MSDESKILELLARINMLENQVFDLQRYHLQTMLTIALAAGGEFRLSEFDYLRIKHHTLATFVDPKNGDRVFVAKPNVEVPDVSTN